MIAQSACMSSEGSVVGVDVYRHGDENWSKYGQQCSQCSLGAQLCEPHPPWGRLFARGRGLVLENVVWSLGADPLTKLGVGLDQRTGRKAKKGVNGWADSLGWATIWNMGH